MNEDQALSLCAVTREEELFKFFEKTESMARTEGFFALEIMRTYAGVDLELFEDHRILIAELASNLAELIPIFFLFAEADPLDAWSRYRPRLEEFRKSPVYQESTFSTRKHNVEN